MQGGLNPIDPSLILRDVESNIADKNRCFGRGEINDLHNAIAGCYVVSMTADAMVIESYNLPRPLVAFGGIWWHLLVASFLMAFRNNSGQ